MGIETFEAPATKPAGGAAAEALLKIDRSRDLLAALPDDNANKSVWKYFLALTETPRPSHKSEKIHARLIDIGARLGVTVKRDAADNIVVVAPAAPGKEGQPAIAMQAHSDMVCSKNEGTEHNFDTDPIVCFIEGNKLKAKGTTLGADDGIGVAAGLAILEEAVSGTLLAPQLELLITANEETDMSGAELLDPAMLTATTLINLDSEEEGKVCFGCAGGFEKKFTLPMKRTPLRYCEDGVFKIVRIVGGKGGHTGININDSICNGIKFLARLMREANSNGAGLQLAAFVGGTAINSIPREARAVVFAPGSSWEQAEATLQTLFKQMAIDFATQEPDLKLELSDLAQPGPDGPLTVADTARALDMIRVLPHGVIRMSPDVEGLPETSVALSVVELQPSQLFCHVFARSSSESQMKCYAADLESLAALLGAQISENIGEFPGWLPNPKSPALQVVVDTFADISGGTKPVAYAVHAGLECGFFLKAFPEMDCVSIGPQINGAHSPDEELVIDTVPTFYNLLKKTILRLSA